MSKLFKSKILVLLLSIIMCVCCTNMHALAASDSQNDIPLLVEDPSFIQNADLEKAVDGNITTFTLKQIAYDQPISRNGSTTQNVHTMVAQFITFNDAEASAVETAIATMRSGSRSTHHAPSTSFYGGTLYLESTINYTASTVNLQTAYRITSVVARASVYNGTVIDSRKIQLHAIGIDLNGNTVVRHPTYSITHYSNPATFTTPADWPYIVNTTSLLGADFICSVYRGSSEVQTFHLANTLFVN